MMRNLLFFLVLTVTALPMDAQVQWFDDSAEWYYEYGTGWTPERSYLKMEVVGDTLIEGKQCKHVYQTIYNDSLLNFPDTLVYPADRDLFFYQDGRKIYRWVDGDFHILYDLDMEVGDTIDVYVSKDTYSIWTHKDIRGSTMSLVVDSIRWRYLGDINKPVKQMRLRTIDKNGNYLFGGWQSEIWGSDFNYFLPEHGLLCDVYCPFYRRCYVEDSIHVGNQFEPIACDTVFYLKVAVDDLDELSSKLHVFPNPLSSSDELRIEYEGEAIIQQVSIYDINGNLIHKNRNLKSSGTIDWRGRSGVYYIQVRIDEGVLTKKIVVH